MIPVVLNVKKVSFCKLTCHLANILQFGSINGVKLGFTGDHKKSNFSLEKCVCIKKSENANVNAEHWARVPTYFCRFDSNPVFLQS